MAFEREAQRSEHFGLEASRYDTDPLLLDIRLPGVSTRQGAWKSLLYAVLEAACDQLEISVTVSVARSHLTARAPWSLVLFDTVPGGAGHVLLVEQALENVLEAALRRVSSCEYGPETSCYWCLRSYGN